MNARNPVNPKLVVASNIPNDNRLTHTSTIYQADAYTRQGETLHDKADFFQARTFYDKALRCYISAKDLYGEGELSLLLGDVERQLENYKSAHRFYSRAAALNVRPHDATMGIALCLRATGHFRHASHQLKRSLLHYQRTNDVEGFAHALWALGTTQRFLGELEEAETHLRKSLVLYSRQKDFRGLAYALCGLGGTLRMRGKAEESGRHYKKANSIFRKLGDSFGTAYSYCGQGNSLRMRGRLSPSLGDSGRALKIYQSLRQKSPLGFVHWTLAQTNIGMKKFLIAHQHLIQAEKLFKLSSDRRGLVYILLGKGELARFKMNSAADRFYRQAFANAKKLDLRLEMVHAQRGLFLTKHPQQPLPPSILTAYKKCGVCKPNFGPSSFLP